MDPQEQYNLVHRTAGRAAQDKYRCLIAVPQQAVCITQNKTRLASGHP